ncbi:MAG: DNA polymerase III subunit beta [Vicingaceae bacterium]|nr:DNA polymerase III subunit beta [Vicingaceae bacterium]
MKFIISSSTLLKKLQQISGVLNTNNTLPILDNFLFEISESELTVTASDLETTISTKTSVESKEDGVIAIPAKLLLDTLKTFPNQPLTFSINDADFGIEISSDQGKYKLSGLNGDEFPKVPQINDPSSITIAASIIENAISKTLFATGNDELRPVMSGVFFELNNDDVTFVATDAHKLVKYRRADLKAKTGSSFIFPKKPLTLLKTILSNVNEDVVINYNETNAAFEFETTKLISRLIDGKYPNYNAVIPIENPNVLTVTRTSFLNSLKRVSIFSNKTTHQIKLKITGSELNISAEDLDFSNEATERLTCQYEGEDMEIGFNAAFLIEMLTNLTSENVSIAMSAPNRAGILTPVEKEDENEEVLMLVMPVMLNN